MRSKNLAQVMIACDCAGTCAYLVMERWTDDEECEFYADFYVRPVTWSWRYRFKAAWRALRGKGPYEPGIVITGAEAHRLSDFLARELVYKADPASTEASGA